MTRRKTYRQRRGGARFTVTMTAPEVERYQGGPNTGLPPGTVKLRGPSGESVWYLPERTALIRGLRVTCDQALTPLNPTNPGAMNEPMYVTWRLSTADLYTHGDASHCVHEFETKRGLYLLNLLHADTLNVVKERFKGDYRDYPVLAEYFRNHPKMDSTKSLLDRFKFYIGEGHGVQGSLRSVEKYPNATRFEWGIAWEGLPQGPGRFARTSYQGEDDVVNLAIATLFPEYDGILNLQSPSFTGLPFHEEAIIFPQLAEKLYAAFLEPAKDLRSKWTQNPAFMERLGARRRRMRRTRRR